MKPCPVQALQMQAFNWGGEMLRSLRRLRHETAACHNCLHLDDCPTRDELNAQIETAIKEIATEWQLTKCSSA